MPLAPLPPWGTPNPEERTRPQISLLIDYPYPAASPGRVDGKRAQG